MKLIADSLLSPPGNPSTQLHKSKGKRSRKRKRRHLASKNVGHVGDTTGLAPGTILSGPESVNLDPEEAIHGLPPHHPSTSTPKPDPHILIGFNAVTRHLEALSTISGNHLDLSCPAELAPEHQPPCRHVAAVFLLRPLDELIYVHLPTLCYTASLAHPGLPRTRLVLLDESAEPQIAKALGLARVSVLAVIEPPESGSPEASAPGMEILTAYVREHIEAVGAGWLADAVDARWLGTKVDVT